MESRRFFSLPDSSEPMGTLISERACPESFDGALCHRFELTSRGDRVSGRLLMPDADADADAHPLILLQPGAGRHKESPELDLAAPWVGAGCAVASIDLPLHGERASVKFSERLLSTLGDLQRAPGTEIGSRGLALLLEFARQGVYDLSRTLDALVSLPTIDSSRIGYVGFGVAATLGVPFCSVDRRPRAIALAGAGGGAGPPEIDPCATIAAIAPRPLLLVEAERDGELLEPESREALFRAAADPKRRERIDADPESLPALAAKPIWEFLSSTIGVDRTA
jgi:dienelactone hydrolase